MLKIDFKKLERIDEKIYLNVLKKMDKIYEHIPSELLSLNEFDNGNSEKLWDNHIEDIYHRHCVDIIIPDNIFFKYAWELELEGEI